MFSYHWAGEERNVQQHQGYQSDRHLYNEGDSTNKSTQYHKNKYNAPSDTNAQNQSLADHPTHQELIPFLSTTLAICYHL